MTSITQNTRGHTLIELIITLAIISILAAFAAPAMQSFYANNLMWIKTQQFGHLLTLARSEAIKRNTAIVICPVALNNCNEEKSWENEWILFEDLNGNQLWEDKEPLLKRITLDESPITLQSSRKPPVVFNSSGRTPGSNTTFIFCDNRGADYARAVILSNSGRYRISEAKSNGKKLDC
jgi:type IV fimbrial biogenesis protein FimT